LGEVLTRSTDTTTLVPEQEYREITVRLWGKGIVLRGVVSGAAIAGTRRFLVRAGQFILSRIDARNGATGIVPPNLDAAVVSNDFPLFDIASTRLDAAFFGWFTKTRDFVELCRRASEGTTNRVRLQEDRFLGLEIPLPSLAEQRRIVARIEELAAKIHEARTLRHQAAEEAEALIHRATISLLDDADWPSSPLDEILAENPRNGLSPQREVESDGRTMLRINAVSSSTTRFVDMTAAKHVDVSDEAAEQFVIRHDDVFIVRYNGDINRVAKPAIYKGTNEGRAVYPDKLIRLRPNLAKMTPDFLVFALSSRGVRAQIEDLGKTTAGNIGISGADIKSFLISVILQPVAHVVSH
jgi:type I restriction enzyme S subunit